MNLSALTEKYKGSNFLQAIEHYIDVLGKSEYQGDNPAIAAVYEPYRASVRVMSLIAVIIILFGLIVPVESAAIAQARVVVLSNRKTVQHLEGGIVQKILVKEGDKVSAGQPLMELSDIAQKANRSIFYKDLSSSQITKARLLALRDGKETIAFDEAFQASIDADEDVGKMAEEQTALFETQRETYQGKLKALGLRIHAANDEITGLEALVNSASDQIKVIDDEIATMGRLVAKGLATKPRLLELQRTQKKLQGDKGQYTATIAKTRQSVNELEVEILNLKSDFASRNSEEMRETDSKISGLSEKLRAASDVVDRTIVVSPSEGVVTGLKFHTEGGVVAPGAPLMDIVPQSEELVVEAKISPSDIDVVVSGLKARVVFSAYKSRNLPNLEGNVTRVSADSFTEPQGLQETSYYTAQIKVDSEQMKTLTSHVKLYPGMPVDVYINTGSRSFVGYLLDPVTDSMHKAFSEQ